MTVIREKDIGLKIELNESTFDYSEILDQCRFPIPAELFIIDKKIGW
ncbi:MAG: hypothetical protein GF353_04555 [Candidatus Lokiarchaeota archaeon]|nr:hypothetical protein [Candidatus Lokiarchaeota archaeon]